MIGKITLDPAHVEDPLRDIYVVAGADAFLPALDAVPSGALTVGVAVTDAAGTVHAADAVAGDDGFWHAHFPATEFSAAFVGTYRVVATVPDEDANAQSVVCGEGTFVVTDGLGSTPTATGYWLNMRGTVAAAASLPATARKGWAYLVGTAAPYALWVYTGSAWSQVAGGTDARIDAIGALTVPSVDDLTIDDVHSLLSQIVTIAKG